MRLLVRRHLAVILVAALLVSVRSIGQETPTDTLQIEVVRDGGAQTAKPLFKVEMRNKADHPLILYLGSNVGRKDYAGEIKFLLTDVNGRVRHLVKRDPAYIAGIIGAYSVTLPAGGTFELLAIDLEDYWSYEPKIATLELPAGRYSLSAEYTGHNPNADFTIEKGKPPFHETFWIGTVRSRTVEFELALPMSYKDKR